MQFFQTFYSKNPKKISPQKNIFNIYTNKKKNYWAPNNQIRMISEGSCDIENLSNGCWKALPSQITN